MDKLTYIICGKLYNGIDDEFKENYKILVKNDKIEAVGPEIPQPESADSLCFRLGRQAGKGLL